MVDVYIQCMNEEAREASGDRDDGEGEKMGTQSFKIL